MRQGLFILLAVVLVSMMMTTTGCSSKKEGDADSIDSTVTTDTGEVAMSETDSLVAATPMPKRADELFDDFFFNFYINKNLQKSRISFPLIIKDEEGERKVTREEWATDHFFRYQEFYSVIANSQKSLRNANDTAVSHVVVEKLKLKDSKVQQYIFNRVDGLWKMQQINTISLAEHNDASFLQFLYNFATDDAFQENHLAETIRYTGPSEDDDEKNVTCDITPDQWQNRVHVFPDNFENYVAGEGFYDIVYGKGQQGSAQRVVSFRGIANGNELKYTFTKNGNNWQLTRYEM